MLQRTVLASFALAFFMTLHLAFAASGSGSVTVTVNPPPMSGSLSSSANSCSISAGSSSCTIPFTWSTTNPQATSAVTRDGGGTVATGNSGSNVSLTVPYNAGTFRLYNNSVELANKSVTSACTSGTSWNGSICQAPMSGSLSPAAGSCTISAGSSSCNINFSWSTTNPQATSSITKPTNVTVATGNSGSNVAFSVKYNTETFYLYNNAVLLAQQTVSSSCAGGSAWNGSQCLAVPGTPGGLSASAGSCSSGTVNVSWSGVSGATGYSLRDGSTVIYTGSSTSYSHTGLGNGSSHSYTIAATNAAGTSSYSGAVGATAPAACVPTCSSATPDGDTTTATSGTRRSTANGVSTDVTSVLFATWSEVGGQDDLVWYNGTKDSSTSWHNDANLASHPGLGAIDVAVYLYSSAYPGGTFCDSSNFTRTAPPAPPVPTGLSAAYNTNPNQNSCDSASASISWNASSGATSYQLQDNGSPLYDGPATSYSQYIPTPGSFHSYTVRATNASSVSSSYSSAVSMTMPPMCTVQISPSYNHSLTISGLPGFSQPGAVSSNYDGLHSAFSSGQFISVSVNVAVKSGAPSLPPMSSVALFRNGAKQDCKAVYSPGTVTLSGVFNPGDIVRISSLSEPGSCF